MAITITNLNPIITPVDDDVLVLDDISEGTTKHITFANLRDSLLSQEAFETNAVDLVVALNGYEGGAESSNGLRAYQLWHANTYRTGDYFLDYNNATNTPDIPANLDDLTNNSGFVKLDTTATPPRLVYLNNEGVGTPTPTFISTFNVPENTAIGDNGQLVGPLYYTDARVETYLDNNFASYYNAFTSTFDDGNVRDSLIGVSATVYDTNLDSGDQQGKVLRVADSSVFANFDAGQTIRIYGADLEGTELINTLATMSIQKVGFADSNSNPDHQADFSYRIAEFDYTTGQIAACGSPQTVTIATPTVLVDQIDDVYQAFNTDNFIRISLLGVREGKGVLVYRRTPQTNDAYVLTAVLGPKEVSEAQFIDYYNFDWVEWSGKSELDNTYPTSVIHFPRIASSLSKRGWIDMTIESKNIAASQMYLTLSDNVFVSNSNQVSIAHNDTNKIRQAIAQNASIDRKSVVLNAKTYVSAQIDIPDNFGVTGTPYITKIVKLPWSGAATQSGKMLNSQIDSGAKNISIVGVDLEGNALNQFLFSDTTDRTRNYAIDLGVNADGPLIDKVRIRNVIAGGVYADRPIDLRFTNSEILNSGLNDRLAYSPIYAYGGQKTTITSNRLENFGDGVDVSNTDKGIVSDNMLNNVGSGLIVYGSKFFISSQNVLVGPAGEFLPTPDTLNSEFDLVNIDLSSAYLAGGDYLSDSMVYQENGQVFDLTQTAGTISNIEYAANYVQKLPNGGEEFWQPENVAPIVFQPRALEAFNGQFGFTIPASTVADIKSATGTNSYTRLTQNTINWNTLIADVQDIVNGATVPAEVSTFLNANLAGYARANVSQSGGIDQADVNAIALYANKDYSQPTVLTESAIFRIKRFLEQALLEDVASATPTFDGLVLARYVRLGNPNHQGIVWRASYENEVSCGTISTAIVPDADNGLEALADGYYHILVRNIQPYLSLGSRVKLVGHGSSVDGQIGTVTYLNTIYNSSTGSSDTTITIKYTSAITQNDLGNNYGTINIVDKFVLAQGRIL